MWLSCILCFKCLYPYVVFNCCCCLHRYMVNVRYCKSFSRNWTFQWYGAAFLFKMERVECFNWGCLQLKAHAGARIPELLRKECDLKAQWRRSNWNSRRVIGINRSNHLKNGIPRSECRYMNLKINDKLDIVGATSSKQVIFRWIGNKLELRFHEAGKKKWRKKWRMQFVLQFNKSPQVDYCIFSLRKFSQFHDEMNNYWAIYLCMLLTLSSHFLELSWIRSIEVR